VKILALCAALMMGTLAAPALYAQTETQTETEEGTAMLKKAKKDKKDRLLVTFNWGFTAAWLTRITYQTNRSNFVDEDFLPGLYFGAELRNVKYVMPMARLAVYYPLTTTFNGMLQKPTVPLHYGIDFVLGARYQPLNLKYLRANVGLGLHMFFLNSERWNYLNMGGALVAGLEVPLFARWTLLMDFYASIDSGNLGQNRRMEPFNVVWQYQFNIGVRYTKKKDNPSSIYGFIVNYKPKETAYSRRKAAAAPEVVPPPETVSVQEVMPPPEAVPPREVVPPPAAVPPVEAAPVPEAETVPEDDVFEYFVR